MFPSHLLWNKDCLPPQNLLKVYVFKVEILEDEVLTPLSKTLENQKPKTNRRWCWQNQRACVKIFSWLQSRVQSLDNPLKKVIFDIKHSHLLYCCRFDALQIACLSSKNMLQWSVLNRFDSLKTLKHSYRAYIDHSFRTEYTGFLRYSAPIVYNPDSLVTWIICKATVPPCSLPVILSTRMIS